MVTTEGRPAPSTSDSKITTTGIVTSTIESGVTTAEFGTTAQVPTTEAFGTTSQKSTTERPLPSCQASPCLNGATCIDFTGGYVCLCANGWTGPMCQTGEKVIHVDCCVYRYLESYAWMVQSGSLLFFVDKNIAPFKCSIKVFVMFPSLAPFY